MLLIKIHIIQDQAMKLNRYTLDYLSLTIEAQEVRFKSSINMKTSSFQEIELKFTSLENVLKL